MPAAATQSDALRVELSSVEVKGLHAAGTLPGVELLFVGHRNGPGQGTLRAVTATSLAWRAPGSANFGGAVEVGAGGSFVLLDGDDPYKHMRVEVYASFLPAGPLEAPVFLQEAFNEGIGGEGVSAAEAAAGDVASWTVELVNASAVALTALRVWLDAATQGLELSWDGASWYAPDSENHADVLAHASLASSASVTLHLRRTIGASAPADPGVLNLIHFAWDSV